MGGIGSGSWYRWNSKLIEECQYRIDVRWLKKQGYLKPGFIGKLFWSIDGERVGDINFRMETDRMILEYRYRHYGGEWMPMVQSIALDRTQCNYGGSRIWFLCPQCSKRVAILYAVEKFYWCRHCNNLTYASQQETQPFRLMRKARKIRKRLGASMSFLESIIDKPKNMHQKTFDRLRSQANQANSLAWLIMGRRSGMSRS